MGFDFFEKTFPNATLRKDRWGQLVRRFRRFYIGLFYKDYMLTNIEEKRTGECHRCGACCHLVYKCPFLGRDISDLPYCRIYGDLRPINCHNFPFDKVDTEIPQCGYKFKD